MSGQEAARALDELARTHGTRLLAVARRICRDEEDARDALQSAYLSAIRGLRTFEGDARLSTWLHRIVVNAALMAVRSRKRKAEEPLDGIRTADETWQTPAPVDRLAAPGIPADERVARLETRARVRACIRRLPPIYRRVLVLRDLAEVSTPETARRLDLTSTAVKVRLHRARRAVAGPIRRQFPERQSATALPRTTMPPAAGMPTRSRLGRPIATP